MKNQSKYSPEVKERAVQAVTKHLKDLPISIAIGTDYPGRASK